MQGLDIVSEDYVPKKLVRITATYQLGFMDHMPVLTQFHVTRDKIYIYKDVDNKSRTLSYPLLGTIFEVDEKKNVVTLINGSNSIKLTIRRIVKLKEFVDLLKLLAI